MSHQYFVIKDNCRNNLVKYLLQALSRLPELEEPLILDLGCGSGVPTLALAEKYSGIIHAVDTNSDALDWLKFKVKERNLSDRIKVFENSVFECKNQHYRYDLIIAERLLNVIGFNKGISLVNNLIKDDGFFIIYDSYKNHKRKINIINKNSYQLTDFFILNEEVWWDDYYRCLENQISVLLDNELIVLFKQEIREIKMYRRNPQMFKSVYDILQKII